MKKYISIHDIEDTTVHIFEIPLTLMVHVKTCADGVAMAFVSDDAQALYGCEIHCDERHRPLLTELIEKKLVHELDEYMLGKVMNDFHDFMESDEKIFVVERYRPMWEDTLEMLLLQIEARWNAQKEAEKQAASTENAHKKAKKHHKNKHVNHD